MWFVAPLSISHWLMVGGGVGLSSSIGTTWVSFASDGLGVVAMAMFAKLIPVLVDPDFTLTTLLASGALPFLVVSSGFVFLRLDTRLAWGLFVVNFTVFSLDLS